MMVSGALTLALRAAPEFARQLAADPATRYQVELVVIIYGTAVTFLREFGPLKPGETWDIGAVLQRFQGGWTNSGAATRAAFKALRERSSELSEDGITVQAQVVILLTDGEATDLDEYQRAIAERK